MAFFMVLYAMSMVDLKKYHKLAGSLGNAFNKTTDSGGGVLGSGSGLVIGTGGASKAQPLKADVAPEFASIVNKLVSEPKAAGGALKYEFDKRGMVIRIPDKLLFPTGSAELTEPAKAVLNRLAKAVESETNPIRVEGHTDDQPIAGGKYPSNWQLSADRATNVVIYWLHTTDINPARLSAAGYGQYHPVAGNDTAGGRTLNRRVDIVVIKQALAKYGPQ